MKGLKGESYQDRVARGADAKQKALDQLRARVPPDPEALAARRAAAEARDAAGAERKAARKVARERAAADSKQADKAFATGIETPGSAPEPTEAERKAARDARYAARKSRR